MTSTQEAKFTAAAGVEPGVLTTGIAMIVSTFLLLWVVWIAKTQFVAWRHGSTDLYGMVSTAVRASVLILLLGWFIR